MKQMIVLSGVILMLASCVSTVKETPDLINLTGEHVHKEEFDMMFGRPTQCLGSENRKRCVYQYKGLVLDSRKGKKDLGEGLFIIRANFGSDPLFNYSISSK